MAVRAALMSDVAGPQLSGLLGVSDTTRLQNDGASAEDIGASVHVASSTGQMIHCVSLASLSAVKPDVIVVRGCGSLALKALLYRLTHPSARLIIWLPSLPSRVGPVGRAVLAAADGILTSDSSEALAFLGLPSSRIYPVLDADPPPASVIEKRDPSAAHRIAYAGELSPRAGVADFLNNAVVWAERHPDRVLDILWIGDGDLRCVLDAQPVPDNLSQTFAGTLTAAETIAAFETCGFLVVPTFSGRNPFLTEAMASGLIAIGSTRDPAVRELLRPGRNGFAFDPLAPFSMLRALDAALNVPSDKLDAMRSAAVASAVRETGQSMAERLGRSLEAVIAGSLPGPAAAATAG